MMRRVAVIGNAGGGKSTLARAVAAGRSLPYFEVDALQWKPDWTPVDDADFRAAHDRILEEEAWVLDGFGSWEAVEQRLEAADTLILVDLPLWVHFWLAAERQIAWHRDGVGADRPAGHASPPPTRDLFEMIWRLDREALPRLRALVGRAEATGSRVIRLHSLAAQEALLAEFTA